MDDIAIATGLQKLNGHGAELTEAADPLAGDLPPPPDDEKDGGREPSVTMTIDVDGTKRQPTIIETIKAAATSPRVFQRDGVLVRAVAPEEQMLKGVDGDTDRGLIIAPWTLQLLTAELTRFAVFQSQTYDSKGNASMRTVAPPAWLVTTLRELGTWSEIRRLVGVVETPTIDAQGKLIMRSGYHASMGLLLRLLRNGYQVPDRPTESEVSAAVATLNELLVDFPFVNPAHKAGAIAHWATIVTQYSFVAPRPLFWFDASSPNSGKTLLERIGAIIATGRKSQSHAWTPNNDDEQRKAITSIAMEGRRSIVFDNLKNGSDLGGPILAKLLTDTTWSDRMLGGNAVYNGQWDTVVSVTGNNVRLADKDMERRVVYIRLEPQVENPEARDPSEFRHPNLEAHVREHQPQLLSALLTILCAYHRAGRPPVDLIPMGSYEKWSEHVRAPLVWAGFADPAEAIELMRDSVSSGDQNAYQVLVGLKHVAEINLGATEWRTQRMHKKLYDRAPSGGHALATEEADNLRAALEELRPPGATGALDSRALGKLIASNRGRVIGGLKLVSRFDKKNKVEWWSVTGSERGGVERA